jgi:hypothetical protein
MESQIKIFRFTNKTPLTIIGYLYGISHKADDIGNNQHNNKRGLWCIKNNVFTYIKCAVIYYQIGSQAGSCTLNEILALKNKVIMNTSAGEEFLTALSRYSKQWKIIVDTFLREGDKNEKN